MKRHHGVSLPVLAGLLLSMTPAYAQWRPSPAVPDRVRFNAGVPAMRSMIPPDQDEGASPSPLVAGLLSAAIPGLGQAYAENWSLNWRSAAYVATEVALWTMMLSYDRSADRQTEEFERFADTHWDVTRYAGWIQSYLGNPYPTVDMTGVVTSTDSTRSPWDRIDWGRLNQVEEAIGQQTGSGFTHRLPRRPEQQYYELIGKYAQYGGGWDDAGSFTPSDLVTDKLSPRFLAYSRMRGRANDLYAKATTAGTLIVVNHIVSALEAAWTTSRSNRDLSARAEMRSVDRGGWSERVAHVSISVKL